MEEVKLSVRYIKFKKFEDINNLDPDFIEIILFKMKEIIGFSVKTVAMAEKIFNVEPLIAIKALIEFKGIEFSISIERTTYENNFLLNITINSDNEEGFFVNLYDLKAEIVKFLKKFIGDVYYLQDTSNQKVCTDLYKRIHDVENEFRQLITIFYIRKIGQYELPKDLKEKANNYSSWYSSKYRTSPFSRIESPLFNLTTETLFEVLERKLFDLDSAEKQRLTEAIDKLNELLEDLQWATEFTISTMKLNDFKKKFEEEFNKYRNKTIFNLFFKETLKEDFKVKWKEFALMRNMVAHNKLICKELYDDILTTCGELTERIKDAKQDMDNFIPEEVLMVDSLYEDQRAKLEVEANELDYQREMSGLEPVWDEDMVVEMLSEKKDIKQLMKILDSYGIAKSFVEDYDEVYYRVDEKVAELDINSANDLKRKVEKEFDIEIEISNFTDEDEVLNDTKAYIMDTLKKYILDNENILSNIDDSKYLDYFTMDEALADFKDLKGNCYSVYMYGTINPDHNYEEDVEIHLTKNNEILKKGYININYGGFDNYDYGENQAENSIAGDITLRFYDFNNEVESIIQEVITSLREKFERIKRIESFI